LLQENDHAPRVVGGWSRWVGTVGLVGGRRPGRKEKDDTHKAVEWIGGGRNPDESRAAGIATAKGLEKIWKEWKIAGKVRRSISPRNW